MGEVEAGWEDGEVENAVGEAKAGAGTAAGAATGVEAVTVLVGCGGKELAEEEPESTLEVPKS